MLRPRFSKPAVKFPRGVITIMRAQAGRYASIPAHTPHSFIGFFAIEIHFDGDASVSQPFRIGGVALVILK